MAGTPLPLRFGVPPSLGALPAATSASQLWSLFRRILAPELLASTLVLPEALRLTGFEWRHPTIEAALEEILNGREPEGLTAPTAGKHPSPGKAAETRKRSLAGTK